MNGEAPQNHENEEEKINYNTPEYGYGNTSELPSKTKSNSSEEKNQLKLFSYGEGMEIFERRKLTDDGKISDKYEYFFKLKKIQHCSSLFLNLHHWSCQLRRFYMMEKISTLNM